MPVDDTANTKLPSWEGSRERTECHMRSSFVFVRAEPALAADIGASSPSAERGKLSNEFIVIVAKVSRWLYRGLSVSCGQTEFVSGIFKAVVEEPCGSVARQLPS